MNEENQVYFVDSDQLPPAALERKHRLEQDPSFRTNHMEYMKGIWYIQAGNSKWLAAGISGQLAGYGPVWSSSQK